MLAIETRTPQIPQGEEATKDSPVSKQNAQQVSEDDKRQILQLIRDYKQGWAWKRREIVKRVLKSKEFSKGNQFIGIDPETLTPYDAIAEFVNQYGVDNTGEDLNLYKYATNFFQMMEFAYVAALSGGPMPNVRWLPKNAERPEDIATADDASTVEEIIERWNKARTKHRRKLHELWSGGCYFEYTRYLVDSDRFGTHPEPVIQISQQSIMPARFVCHNCGASTPEDQIQNAQDAACPECGTPFNAQDYFPEDVGQIPIAQEETDVPNGMVLQSVFGPMHVDADPEAEELRQTPILNLEQEVSKAWLRTSFPDFWAEIKDGAQGVGAEAQQDKLARQVLYSPVGAKRSYGTQLKPTYSRTWIQNFAFAHIDDKTLAQKLQGMFPDGCMVSSVGDDILDIRPAKLTNEWTWCGTRTDMGLYPPAVGDPAIPVQERINDCANLIHEYMDRLACGMILGDEGFIDTKALNGKAMLPGTINPVLRKKGAPQGSLAEAIVQIKTEINQQIFAYVQTLRQDMELLVGTPPQLFGAGTQQGVETASGQEQQLNTANGKLGLFWDNIKEEAAEAAEIAVQCAARNMTEDWISVVTNEAKGYENKVARLDRMKGNVHAEPELDQGFPMTAAQIREWWERVFENADTQLVQMLLSEPQNLDLALRYAGAPGAVVPGVAMRQKVLRDIDQLKQGQAMEQDVDIQTGIQQMVKVPSVLPDKELDDLGVSQKVVRLYAQEHAEELEENPQFKENLLAYYRLVVEYQNQQMQAQMPPMAAPKQLPQGAQQ